MYKYLLCLLTGILLNLPVALPQPHSGLEKKVLREFYQGDFRNALEKSRNLLERSPKNPVALFVAGESARRMHDYSLAEKYLGQIPSGIRNGIFSATDYWLGHTKKHLGKYNEAIFHFSRYLGQHPGENDKLAYLANEEIRFCKWALEQKLGSEASSMDVHTLPGNVNSIHADIAPLRYADKLYFTSVRENEDPDIPPVTRIFSSIQQDPVRLEEEINTRHQNVHASHTALMPDASRIYFTYCRDETVFTQRDCEIWSREKQYDGQWGPPQKLPNNVNLPNYTATQPSIGWDRYLRSYVLYFVSDRPGGEGGLDIWGAQLKPDGSFQDPFPLPFNTGQDEVTPFFHMASQTLFFSSNGLPNLGGFDIFRSVRSGPAQWHLPVNLGMPLNTSYDEFYYSFHNWSGKAYFASNRPGTLCPEFASPFACSDIFEARIIAHLQVKVFNMEGSKAVNNPIIEIHDLSEGDKKYASVPSGSNSGSSELKLGTQYRIIVKSPGYKPASFKISTENLANFKSFEKEVYLIESDPSA